MQQPPVARTGPELILALVKNLKAMTKNQVKETQREAKKISMVPHLSINKANMFTLLSVKDWKDEKTKMILFMEKLTKAKDAMKALNLMASCTREWKGVMSRKGLTHFSLQAMPHWTRASNLEASQSSCSNPELREFKQPPQ
jgi:endoglucanase Acf2